MNAHVVYRGELRGGLGEAPRAIATCLVDLGLPCHLACAVCWRAGPPQVGGLAAARNHLLAAASCAPAERLRAVFYGGDVFTAPHAFAALLADAGAACEEHGRALEALVLSDGVGWTGEAVRDLARRGVRLVQVTLEGRAEVHDRQRPLAGGAGSFSHILASLRRRGGMPVVVRMNALAGDGEVDALAGVLDREGLFGGENPVRLFVSPPAPYREQVLELLELVEQVPAAARADPARA
ncbi:hypothetical protein [Anaeromyxobacter diazotrophicus]|uniref:Radical SAM domain protein n=1 Tax=Anaeromyxobacter diazotrophicus TaxID=2590199 RepID=A0A7I9VH55_9BACT|nr:hypothetical protein [Anaeromyxobacter diazotrophicus]GEJ55726.1 hypothetical protein AMYX_04670 [Anaeromyxobacter diazotrophicus]